MYITWSWLSFFAGAVALITLEFWAVVFVAIGQYKKQKKKAASSSSDWDNMLQQWGSRNKGTETDTK